MYFKKSFHFSSGFIHGLPDDGQPQFLSFQKNYKHGALLSVVSTNIRLLIDLLGNKQVRNTNGACSCVLALRGEYISHKYHVYMRILYADRPTDLQRLSSRHIRRLLYFYFQVWSSGKITFVPLMFSPQAVLQARNTRHISNGHDLSSSELYSRHSPNIG